MRIAIVGDITDEGILLTHKGVSERHNADWYVICMGYVSENRLAQELEDLGDKIVAVGDAIKPRTAEEAGSEGFEAGYFA